MEEIDWQVSYVTVEPRREATGWQYVVKHTPGLRLVGNQPRFLKWGAHASIQVWGRLTEGSTSRSVRLYLRV